MTGQEQRRHAAIVEAIEEFDFSDYGMDDIDVAIEHDREAQDWIGDLATAVAGRLRDVERANVVVPHPEEE